MNFPLTRHLQRYEYVVEKGYITDKTVLDFGCGIGVGTFFLSAVAKNVIGLDTIRQPQYYGINATAKKDRIVFITDDGFNFEHKVDVVVAIEVFEHVSNPHKFIEHVARICDYAFFTTPLSDVTKKTVNPDHVAEYSAQDFDSIVSEHFDIVEKVYQNSDMTLVDKATSRGCSFDGCHVVQMIWARSKHGK